MTTDILRKAAKQLSVWHHRFAPWFGRLEAQTHAEIYIKGLLLHPGRKSVEPMALTLVPAVANQPRSSTEPRAMQRFLTDSPWSSIGVQREVQAVFAEELAPAADELGVVGVVDESSFVKQGTHSVGVARQHCGRLGKVENCQVGVFVIGVTPAGSALLEHQLYLPQEWANDRERREEARVPAEIPFQTKQEIALGLLSRISQNGLVKLNWIAADEGYGRDGDWLDGVDRLGLNYLAEVPKNTTVWVEDPREWMGDDPRVRRATARVQHDLLRRVDALAANLRPADWQVIQLREGGKGPLAFEFACFRVWASRERCAGPPIWVLVRRSLEPQPEYKYYVSNASADTPPPLLAKVSGCRWRVEQYFEDGKSDLGMADYEARKWSSWHHHMSLVGMAHLFVTLTRRDAQCEVPELTLELALRLLRDALPRPELPFGDSLNLVEYHLQRNATARKSHRKTWLTKHRKAAKKLSL